MKILITTDLYTTDTNGVVTSVKNLYGELKSKGHDVRILTISESAHSYKEGDVYYIRSMPFAVYPNVRMPLSYRHTLIKELVEWCPDVIHSQCEFFSLEFAKYLVRKTKAPLVHTYHTLYEQYASYLIPSKRLGKFVVRKVSKIRLKSASRIVVPTKKVEEALHGYDISNPISVVPSGIKLDQHKIRITPQERVSKREALGISKDSRVIINLGRLGAEKNLSELIDYFSRVVLKTDDLYFLIVGDGPAKEQLEKQSEELGISDKVIFTGMIPPTQVHEYYQLADVFVSASTSETQGLTYVEAAANGLPLICRRDPCIEGVVIDGENGYQYDDEDDFTEKLLQALSDPEWREHAKEKSEAIASLYDKKTFGCALEEIYKSLVELQKQA